MTPEDYKDNRDLTIIPNEAIAADESGKKIFSDGLDPKIINRNTCRRCLKTIKPYNGIYWGFEWFCMPVFYKYSASNSYCEECAKKAAEEITKPVNGPEVLEVTRDPQGLPITYYADGLVEYEDEENAKFKRSHF